MRENAVTCHMLFWERWKLMLTHEETAAHETMRTLLTYFMEDALEELKLTRRSEPSTFLTARALSWLGNKFQNYINGDPFLHSICITFTLFLHYGSIIAAPQLSLFLY
jgi:hypothetical protein